MGVSRYNITSSAQSGYTWFRVAKCGTRTILSILLKETSPNINGYNVRYSKRAHERHFKFCFIRNPWDRLVSCYANKILTKKIAEECWDKDFAYFVHYVARQDISSCNAHYRRQTALFPPGDMDFVGRFEKFSTDLEHVFNSVLKLDVDIPWKNSSVRSHYAEYYDNSLVDLVAKLYKEDIEFGKYTFE